jgi:hypothetical protein
MPKPTSTSGLTLIAAIVILCGLGGAFILLGNGSDHITGYVTAFVGLAITQLLTLYKAGENGDKADTAAQEATAAKEVAEQTAQKADTIHGLVNGGLETRVRSALGQVLIDMVGPDGKIIMSAPPSTPPKDSTNG